MTRLISAEFLKLRKRLMTRVLLLVYIGIVAALFFLLLAISKANLPQQGPGGGVEVENLLGLPLALDLAVSFLSSVGTIMAVILSASAVGSEYSWRTMRTMLMSSESRAKLLWAKLMTVTAFVIVGAIIGVAAGFGVSMITTALGGYSFDFDFMTPAYLWRQFLQFWRTLYVIMPYVLLGFLFAVLGRSAMPGIAFGVGVFFLESLITTFMNLAGGWIARVPEYLLSANVRAITSLGELPESLQRGGDFVGNVPGVWHAAAILAAYSLVFLVLAFYLFHKRDVTG